MDSSSSSSIEEVKIKKKFPAPKLKVKHINFMVIKDDKPYYDVDVANGNGDTVGVQLLSGE